MARIGSRELTRGGAGVRLRRALLAAAATALALGLLLLTHEVRRPAADPAVAPADDRPTGPAGAAPRPAGSGASTSRPFNAEYAQHLADYVHNSVYPPWSRPLTSARQDLLEPNVQHEEPVGHSNPALAGLTLLLTTDKHFAVEEDALAVTLEVRRGDELLAVQDLDVRVQTRAGPDQQPRSEAVSMRRDARGAYVARIVPGRMAVTAGGGDLDVQATMRVLGVNVTHSVPIHVTPPSQVPARFTGEFRDGVEDGSLVVTTGLVVERPGPYLVQANLVDSRDRPIAFARFEGMLGAGRADVPLRFFGKIIHDRQAVPPFRVAQIRGERVDATTFAVSKIPYHPGAHPTAAHALSAFSAADYDGPDRRKRIAHFRSLVETYGRPSSMEATR